jgi:hypothetical protein
MVGFMDTRRWVMTGPKWKASGSGRRGTGRTRYMADHIISGWDPVHHSSWLLFTDIAQCLVCDRPQTFPTARNGRERPIYQFETMLIELRTDSEGNTTPSRLIPTPWRTWTKICPTRCRTRSPSSRSIKIGFGVRLGVAMRAWRRQRRVCCALMD